MGQHSNLLLAKNTLLNLSGQVLLSLIAIASLPWVVKALNPEAFGILSLAWMLLAYSNIFDLGIGQATVRSLALCFTCKNDDEFGRLTWTSVALQGAIGVGAAVVLAPFIPYAVTHWFKIPASWKGETELSLFALVTCLPVLLVGNALRSVLQAAQRFDIINVVRIPTSGLMFVAAAVTASVGARVATIVISSIVVRCFATVAFAICCFRLFPSIRQAGVCGVAARRLLSFGGWVAISNTAGPLVTYIERFLIASCLSVGLVGFYSTPFDLTSKLLILPASIVPALYPLLTIKAAHGSQTASEMMEKATSWLLFMLAPVCALFVAFARPILLVWLGPEFALQSADVMRMLAVAFFCNTIAQMLYVGVMTSGRPDLKVVFDVISVPLFAIVCWRFLRVWGINGAALAKLALATVDCIFLMFVCRRLKALRPQRWSGPLASATAIGLLLLAVGYGISQSRCPLPLQLSFFLTSVTVYGVTFWKLVLDGDDRAAFKFVPRQIIGRVREVALPVFQPHD